jgi:hypothetical protein
MRVERSIKQLVGLLVDESAQDLLEYTLLIAPGGGGCP